MAKSGRKASGRSSARARLIFTASCAVSRASSRRSSSPRRFPRSWRMPALSSLGLSMVRWARRNASRRLVSASANCPKAARLLPSSPSHVTRTGAPPASGPSGIFANRERSSATRCRRRSGGSRRRKSRKASNRWGANSPRGPRSANQHVSERQSRKSGAVRMSCPRTSSGTQKTTGTGTASGQRGRLRFSLASRSGRGAPEGSALPQPTTITGPRGRPSGREDCIFPRTSVVSLDKVTTWSFAAPRDRRRSSMSRS